MPLLFMRTNQYISKIPSEHEQSETHNNTNICGVVLHNFFVHTYRQYHKEPKKKSINSILDLDILQTMQIYVEWIRFDSVVRGE